MTTIIRKAKKKYTLDDITRMDIELLVRGLSLQPKQWMCYGSSWHRLWSLGLIDEDTRVTPDGYEVLKSRLENLQ